MFGVSSSFIASGLGESHLSDVAGTRRVIVSEDDHHNQLNGTERREEHPNPVTTIDDDVGKTGEMIGTKLGKGTG